MENRNTLSLKLIVGGALIGALLITSGSIFAYDQENTHPALTDEIVDFYNLSFPDKKITKEEKDWLIQGAIEEDIGERPLFHFYDPVYNRGIAHFSSKDWALKQSAQANYYNSQLTGFAAISGGDSTNDFSYGRALDDYTKGDKERAFVAFGHTLHLLEDAGVPDHTRNDAHPAFIHGQESPYEHEMAKWNPNNFKIARKLFLTREKPVALSDMADYFDKIANYSNNNFFSKDTISNIKYKLPKLTLVKKIRFSGIEMTFIVNQDKNGTEIPIALIQEKSGNISLSIYSPEIGSFILDGYWDRLSKEIVLNGAGALNLFLTEAKKAKTEYTNKPQEKPNWFAKLVGLIGNGFKELTISDGEATSDIKKGSVDNLNDGDSMVTPTSKVTNPSVSPTPLVTKIPVTSDTVLSPSVSPLKTPITEVAKMPTPAPSPKIPPISSSGGGGGGSSSTPTPTPTPSPSMTPTPTPTPDQLSPLFQVVINEIAWMGTATSSSDEWMELYNTTNQTIDLTGWTLKSLTGTSPDPQITLTGSIGPFGFYLLERTDDTAISDIFADKTYTGALGNGGEYLELRNVSGNLQDLIDGSSAWLNKGIASPDYKSMERIDPKKSGNDSTNWATNDGIHRNGLNAGGGLINGTPRSKNSVYVALKPSTVTNLAVTNDFGRFSLTWLASSDSDTLPINLAYDLRYATKSFTTADDWDTAYELSSTSLPSVAESGAPASASFNVLNSYNQKWYFALKTKDTMSSGDVSDMDMSDISNIVDMMIKSALSDSWSMLGANRYHTSFAHIEGVVPVIPQKATISWEFDIGADNFVGQPVISEKGNVYFSSSNGKFYSLDKNGSQNWQYIGSSGKSDGLVVLADGTTYFGHNMSGSSDVTALNPDGSLKWIYYTSGTGPLTLAGDGSVYFASWDNKLNALKPDGSLKWQISNPIGNFGTFSPTILENGNIVIPARVSGHSYFYAYASKSGSQIWDATFPEGYGYLPSHPSFDLDTDKINSAVGNYLVQISETGELIKTLIDSSGISTTMVAISSSKLLIGLDFTNYNPASGSMVIALDRSTKEIKWQFNVDSSINNQMAIDKDENVYFSTRNGKLYGLNTIGGLMWVIDADMNTDISPILTKNALIWGYGNKLTKIDIK